MISRLLFLLFLLGPLLASKATHNRAGEITFRHIIGFQYEATITTYTKSDSPADRPQLPINWGDGLIDTLPRVNGGGLGEMVAIDTKKNVYVGLHTFPAASSYIISFEDPNRNGGVVNIPNSVNIPFFVSSTLIINPFLGVNNSVQLLNPPIDEACAGQLFMHNPGAYDPDGDSLSYRLVSCRGENGEIIPGFTQPVGTNSFTLNPFNGDLIWDTPSNSSVGEYNVAFVIEEWRNGVLVGLVTRDMQINVVPCNNRPPSIEPLPNLCVNAGDTVAFTVEASDPDNPVQLVTLSATGGAFQFAAPGNAIFTTQTGAGLVQQNFSWLTSCAHIRKQAHTFSFKAIDNGNPNLTTFQTVSVRVVAPAVDTLLAEATGNAVSLVWSPSPCAQAVAYDVYRRNGFYGSEPALCETGVPSYTGYSFLGTVQAGDTTYTDGLSGAGLLPGQKYCYMVVCRFADGAESYASNEACVELPEVIPVISRVSVLQTDVAAGRMALRWSKPDDLDTLQWPGPYQYVIERAEGLQGTSFQVVANRDGLNDTTYTDTLLNTSTSGWNYRVRLEQPGTGVIGQGLPSSSVFLQITPSDNTLSLSWQTDVLWTNDSTIVYRFDPANSTWISIDTVSGNSFADTGLANGVEYCYRVETMGAFSADGFPVPIRNFSQESCSSAIDNTPPQPPEKLVFVSCDSLNNTIEWTGKDDEAVSYRLYFKRFEVDAWLLIDSFPLSVDEFTHFPGTEVAGCYAVAAVDSFQNESILEAVCVDNCPEYSLPNTFSPNGDGKNDVFMPFPYRFIDGVEFTVYNRWGIEVFKSSSADLLWNGRIANSGALLPDGVYYYICVVNEQRLQGIVPRTLKGTIYIIGSRNTDLD
jgi:gliding motility-associated-like protein